jgi:hypothetical protein
MLRSPGIPGSGNAVNAIYSTVLHPYPCITIRWVFQLLEGMHRVRKVGHAVGWGGIRSPGVAQRLHYSGSSRR